MPRDDADGGGGAFDLTGLVWPIDDRPLMLSRGLLLVDKLRWCPAGGALSPPPAVPALEVLPERARPPWPSNGAPRGRLPRLEKLGSLTPGRDDMAADEEGGMALGGLEVADDAGGAPGLGGLLERVGEVERRERLG